MTEKPLIAVVGSASPSDSTLHQAEQLGEKLLSAGFRIITGGLSGVMAAVGKGSRKSACWSGNEVIGVLPGWRQGEGNPWIDIPIRTELGTYRNNLLVNAADAVIGLEGGAGTLSELALAWQAGKPIAVLDSGGWSSQLGGLCLDHRRTDSIQSFSSASEFVSYLKDLFPLGCFSFRGGLQWRHDVVPCLHRLHSVDSMPPFDSAHGIQAHLGFSLLQDKLEDRLSRLIANVAENNYPCVSGRASSRCLLVTFDDGYRDVLAIRPFFRKHKKLQPVLFVPAQQLLGESEVLWFDLFYGALAAWMRKGASLNQVLTLAQGKLKTKLKNSLEPSARKQIRDWMSEQNISVEEVLYPQYLQPQDLKTLQNEGWILASHGLYHHDLRSLSDRELTNELSTALEITMAQGGVAWLAYPDGKWDERVRQAALKVGYNTLFAIDNDLPKKALHQIDRTLFLE